MSSCSDLDFYNMVSPWIIWSVRSASLNIRLNMLIIMLKQSLKSAAYLGSYSNKFSIICFTIWLLQAP